MAGDNEDLLAEALRAKAVQTGGDAATTPISTGQTDRLRTDAEGAAGVAPEPARLTTGWILLLAILLGLATGAVIGLLTVL